MGSEDVAHVPFPDHVREVLGERVGYHAGLADVEGDDVAQLNSLLKDQCSVTKPDRLFDGRVPVRHVLGGDQVEVEGCRFALAHTHLLEETIDGYTTSS